LKPSETSPGICTGTLQNLARNLHRNPSETQQVSVPEPSGTPPEPCPEAGVEAAPDRTRANLGWAKDPIAKFCCWGKKNPKPEPKKQKLF